MSRNSLRKTQFFARKALLNELFAKCKVDTPFRNHVKHIQWTSRLLEPIRAIEARLFQNKVQNTSIQKEPLFILGLPRSGTTFLHKLLCQDPQWAYLQYSDALLFDMVLTLDRLKLSKFIAKQILPEYRPMDRMRIDENSPEEEGVALANMIPTIRHSWWFPKDCMEYIGSYLQFKRQDTQAQSLWMKEYEHLVKKLSYKYQGRRLALKDPSNTAMIPQLLELYPNAKFIYIVRNPYNTFLSQCHLFQAFQHSFQLQTAESDSPKIKNTVIHYSRRLQKKYILDKKLIQPNNLVELKYENLVEKPIPQIQIIYETLQLDGFSECKNHLENSMKQGTSYKRNQFVLTEEDRTLINQFWKITFQEFSYQRIEPL